MNDPIAKLLQALGVESHECLWQDREDGSVTVITDEGAFDVPPENVLVIPPATPWIGDEA